MAGMTTIVSAKASDGAAERQPGPRPSIPERAGQALRRLGQPFLGNFNGQERRLVVQVALIGLVVSLAVLALKEGVHWLFEAVLAAVEASPTPLLIFVPLLLGAAGATWIVLRRPTFIQYHDKNDVIHELNDVEGDGLERAIALYFSSEPALEHALLGREGVEARWELPTFRLAGRKWLATLLTLGSGGSGGLEASVALVGESMAAGFMKPRALPLGLERTSLLARFLRWWLPSDPDDLQTAQLAGVAAAVAALLGAPFAAAFFAVEVMYRRRPIVEKLLFALIAALVAFFVSTLVTGHPALFQPPADVRPPATARYYAILLAMAVIIAVISVLFVQLRRWSEVWFRRVTPDPWRRHLLGAAITGIVALLAVWASGEGLELVLSTGTATIEAAMLGRFTTTVAVIALAAKMLATLATVTSGGSAGLLIPAVFFGSMVAAALAPLVDLPAIVLIAPAMVASLGALVNVPLAAVLFAVEAFGSSFMIPGLLVLVVVMLLVHENTIYRTQRETYEARQILPGYSVRRIPAPPEWVGKTLVDLRVRNRYDLNVIGMLESYQEDGQTRYEVRFNPSLGKPLAQGDILIVLGEDARLDALLASLEQQRTTLVSD